MTQPLRHVVRAGCTGVEYVYPPDLFLAPPGIVAALLSGRRCG